MCAWPDASLDAGEVRDERLERCLGARRNETRVVVGLLAMKAIDRRAFLGLVGAAMASSVRAQGPAAPARPIDPQRGFERRLRQIERGVGGRLGACAIDTADGAILAYRADERFAMCSTFKWVLAGAVLERIDAGELSSEQYLTYGAADLLSYAPITRAHLAEGRMTVEALCRAAVDSSDNTAANLLLSQVGGPAAVTAFFRALGDSISRLDRTEPSLNTNLVGDERDTSTPRAMAGSLCALLEPRVLTASSRDRLIGWLLESRTGADRLPAGLPAGWRIAHKTGTGERGATNDVGIVFPPRRAPIALAVFASGSSASLERRERAHASVAAVVSSHRERGEVTELSVTGR